MSKTFKVYGDSHMDEIFGIGARKPIQYECNFRHDVQLLENNAKAGSQVADWIVPALQQVVWPEVMVVSSGFNEAVAISMGMTTRKDVVNYWKLLIQASINHGSKVLWVPTQYKYGRAKAEFPETEYLHVAPVCLGATLLDWDPAEADLCPDRIHHNYETSYRLAKLILDKVATL